MTIFDLLFLALALGSVVTLIAAAGMAVSGHRRAAGLVAKRWAIGFGAYMAVVAGTSIFLPRQVAKVGEAMCSDDWCLTVTGIERVAGAYRVGFLIESRAKRVTQRERGVSVYLADAAERQYGPREEASEVPFDVAVGPGDRVETSRTFDLPSGVKPAGLVIRRGSGFPIAWFIIGYPTWFRKADMVRLGEVSGAA